MEEKPIHENSAKNIDAAVQGPPSEMISLPQITPRSAPKKNLTSMKQAPTYDHLGLTEKRNGSEIDDGD